MSYFYTVLGFVLLIILHEAGHFAAAKATGMRVERFSLFFGKPLVSARRGETEYGIGWLPAGGYVKITGMNPEEELGEERQLAELERQLGDLDGPAKNGIRVTDQITLMAAGPTGRVQAIDALAPAGDAALRARIASLRADIEQIKSRGYYNQAVWKRVVVILAGPIVNLLIAFFVLFGLFATGPIYLYNRHGQPVAGGYTIARATSAPAAGTLKPGDVIVAIDGDKLRSIVQLQSLVGADRCSGPQTNGCLAARPLDITVRRQSRLLTLSLRPRYDAKRHRALLGIEINEQQASKQLGVLGAAHYSVEKIGSVTGRTISAFVRIFEPKERKQLHGVVGVVAVTSQEFSFSSVDAFGTLALISLSLAIVNLFPFLPLDGGHVFWALAEKVRGRRISFATMERAGFVGFALIIVIFVIGLSNDISTLTGGGFNVR
jgi:regulator of sigma E protease